jgi:hypothetical protein
LDKLDQTEKDLKKYLDQGKEKALESVESSAEEKVASAEKDVPGQSAQPPSFPPAEPIKITKSPLVQEIENILSENLEDLYFNMDEAHQRLFKEEGEKTAFEISHVIALGKSVAAKVLELIKQWLKFIPGINKFFLEQEAKIKTDKIININSKH